MAGSSGRPVSLPGLVRWRAERQADGVAITLAETGARTTWGDLHERAVRWAAMLRAVGVERGDVVATMLGRGDHAAVSWVGTAGTGALEAPLRIALAHGGVSGRAHAWLIDAFWASILASP